MINIKETALGVVKELSSNFNFNFKLTNTDKIVVGSLSAVWGVLAAYKIKCTNKPTQELAQKYSNQLQEMMEIMTKSNGGFAAFLDDPQGRLSRMLFQISTDMKASRTLTRMMSSQIETVVMIYQVFLLQCFQSYEHLIKTHPKDAVLLRDEYISILVGLIPANLLSMLHSFLIYWDDNHVLLTRTALYVRSLQLRHSKMQLIHFLASYIVELPRSKQPMSQELMLALFDILLAVQKEQGELSIFDTVNQIDEALSVLANKLLASLTPTDELRDQIINLVTPHRGLFQTYLPRAIYQNKESSVFSLIGSGLAVYNFGWFAAPLYTQLTEILLYNGLVNTDEYISSIDNKAALFLANLNPAILMSATYLLARNNWKHFLVWNGLVAAGLTIQYKLLVSNFTTLVTIYRGCVEDDSQHQNAMIKQYLEEHGEDQQPTTTNPISPELSQ
ncbi:hypothetical protein DFA_05652 [Cavenderia fasciculata]|uniref:Uncharacterized protein n=1 Tax=Cavenderia fasciculata TaxID=261658 RepID=F4PLW5_CACFS|nr:uncharacterized protein DFA_05652 [Cavenderia fasciculata]EGG23519.1 hypothetical protein DFA_05652 [Cavenderia fasciculata]|eukprot:XP_004361370.1 hypothetical protein DFA_05652 [Cavenderia fasciculata]